MTVHASSAPPIAAGLHPGDPAPRSILEEVRSLYVHIPFCERKCEYCDFMSVAGTAGEHEYVAALRDEIRVLGRQLPGVRLETIFVGGGTPSLIDPELLASVAAEIRCSFDVAPGAEITLEANPSSTTRERARAWLGAGFNRLSIGVQSLEPDILTFLGRVHDPGRALAAVEEVRAAGFESINCDLIYAVPGLDDARWQRTVQRIADVAPGHVSCYELTVEPGTPLHTAVRRGRVTTCDPELALAQHRIAMETLAAAGYAQYEVSNFARPGRECRHNLAYWSNAYYVAAGVGAHGHIPAAAAPALGIAAEPGAVSTRYWHGRGIAAFVAAVRDGFVPIRGSEPVGAEMRERERIMLGLRLRSGVSLESDASLREARDLAAAGLLVLDGRVTRTTRDGEALLNAVTLRLTSGMFS